MLYLVSLGFFWMHMPIDCDVSEILARNPHVRSAQSAKRKRKKSSIYVYCWCGPTCAYCAKRTPQRDAPRKLEGSLHVTRTQKFTHYAQADIVFNVLDFRCFYSSRTGFYAFTVELFITLCATFHVLVYMGSWLEAGRSFSSVSATIDRFTTE